MDALTLLHYPFVQQAFAAGISTAVLCATLGLFLVLKKMSFIGDGLSHVGFGAIALGLFLGIFPLYAALPVTLLAAVAILRLAEKTKIYSDAAIAMVSALGMALGVILVSVSGGLNLGLFSYLFGNILTITRFEVLGAITLSLAALGLIIFFYHDLLYATFDAESAKVAGIKVNLINAGLAIGAALTVVLAVRIVGVMLVSALLVIPPAAALQIGRGFKQTLLISAALAAGAMIAGIFLSLALNFPTGATIVIVNFAVFCAVLVFKKISI